jgi:dipeptidyl aminopeptidase/acylaminoacyl peptidase
MTRWLRVCPFLLLLAAPILAQPERPSRVFEPRDLFSLEVAADPQISPDGSMVAYVRHSGDIMSDRMRRTIWLANSRTAEAMPLAAGPGAHSQPRWSPDGKRLAYVSTAEGGAAQLFVRWMESGEAVRITGLPQAPTSMAWSPDGRRIAYSMLVPDEGTKLGTVPAKPEDAQWAEPLQIIGSLTYRADGQGYLKPGYTHVFLVSADGGAPRQMTHGAFHHPGPLAWAPDGRTIYLSANRSADWERDPLESELHALDVETGEIRTLTRRKGPDLMPAVSPDGSRLAYIGFDDRQRSYENFVLYAIDRDGANGRPLTMALDRGVNAPVWAADGRSIYVSYDDRGSTKVARVGLDGSVATVAEGLSGDELDRPYTGGSFTVARDGSLAISSGSATRPADIVLVRSGTRTPLTRLNAELFEGKTLGSVQRLETTSSHDGRPIEAWLTLPPRHVDGQRHPLILEIHGGPFAAYGPHFSTDNQLYATAGYAVLSVNPRGSTSYGAEFANLIHHAYPGNDYDDLVSAVDAAIGAGVADPDHLFVTGGSGGGVLTSWIVGKTNRFKAAATQKPVIHWSSMALTSDGPAFFARYWFGKYPWEDPTGYWARSPLSLVGNVKTPTLVVVGGEDYRTPVSESEQYYTALQLRGVPTMLIKVPGASHGLTARPSQNAARISAILAWFERYKDGVPAQSTAR